MSYRVTATEVRNRLKNLTSADISDAVLEDLAFIPTSEAEINVILSDSGFSYAGLSTDKQTLVKAAQIAMTCQKIVTDAPEEIFKTGLLDAKAVSAGDKIKLAESLEKECTRLLSRAGVRLINVFTGVNEGSDYKPDGDDDTNLLWGDTEDDIVSVFP